MALAKAARTSSTTTRTRQAAQTVDRAVADDHGSTLSGGCGGVFGTVHGRTGKREKGVALLDGAAVGGGAGNLGAAQCCAGLQLSEYVFQ